MTHRADWAGPLEPFIEFLGIRVTAVTEDDGELVLDLEPHHLNRFDVAHGGVLMAMLDLVMALACRAADRDHRHAITIEMKTAFVQPARGTLRCSGKCLHRSGALAFGEARVVDATGEMVAFASGTFKYMKP